jgi:3-methyladenine DNA glycosylase Mpg
VITVDDQARANLVADMTAAARELLGPGFTSEYYAQAASGFVMVAESYIDEVGP